VLAGLLADNGRDDEAASARVFYPVMVENLERGEMLESRQAIVRGSAGRLAGRSPPLDQQTIPQPPPD